MQENREVFFVCVLAGPIRPDRKAHAVGHRPVGALRQICEGEDGGRAELRQAAQVGAHAPMFPFDPAMPGAVTNLTIFFDGRNLTKKYAKRGSKDELDCK